MFGELYNSFLEPLRSLLSLQGSLARLLQLSQMFEKLFYYSRAERSKIVRFIVLLKNA